MLQYFEDEIALCLHCGREITAYCFMIYFFLMFWQFYISKYKVREKIEVMKRYLLQRCVQKPEIYFVKYYVAFLLSEIK